MWRVGRPNPKDDFRTPRDLYARLHQEFRFDIDAACSSTNRLAEYGYEIDRGRDALEQSWSDEANAAFCNPPYSQLQRWVRKCAEEGQRMIVAMLVPADPSTRWWRTVRTEAAEVRFIEGRIWFDNPDGRPAENARTASAVVVFSPAGGPPRHSYMPARVRAQRELAFSRAVPA